MADKEHLGSFIAMFLIFGVFFILLRDDLLEQPGNPESTSLVGQAFETYTLFEEKNGLVRSFPGIPQYPNAKLVKSKYYGEEGGVGHEAEYTSGDSLSEIIHWYNEVLAGSGWEIIFVPKFPTQESTVLLSAKLDDQLLHVRVQKKEVTTVTLTHHQGMGEFGKEGYE